MPTLSGEFSGCSGRERRRERREWTERHRQLHSETLRPSWLRVHRRKSCAAAAAADSKQQQRERRIDIDREGGRGEIRSGDAPRSSPRRWNPSAGRGPCRSGRRRRAARTRVGQSVDGWREAVSGRRKQGHVPMLRTRTRRSHAAPVTPAGVLHVRSRATHAPSLGTLRIATRSDHCAMMISQGSRRKY